MNNYQTAQIEAAQEFHANEMDVSDDAFTRFCRAAEKALSLPKGGLDGDEREDGYSIDGAYDWFFCRAPLAEYVASVKAKMATMQDSLLASYGPGDEIPGAR